MTHPLLAEECFTGISEDQDLYITTQLLQTHIPKDVINNIIVPL